jgi:hypothetical protein
VKDTEVIVAAFGHGFEVSQLQRKKRSIGPVIMRIVDVSAAVFWAKAGTRMGARVRWVQGSMSRHSESVSEFVRWLDPLAAGRVLKLNDTVGYAFLDKSGTDVGAILEVTDEIITL